MTTNNAARALVFMGGAAIVAGGLVAAVTRPFDWELGSWVAAYLVLVVGVAQYVMGHVRLTTGDAQGGLWQLALWNLGSAGVIAGTCATTTWLVDLGSVLLVIALIIAAWRSWDSTFDSSPTGHEIRGLALGAYRFLLAVMIVSIPVGVLLSHLRHG